MIKKMSVLIALSAAAMVFFAGCSKPVAKVEPQSKPAPAPEKKPEPAPAPAPVADTFKVEDIDALMRGVFLPVYFEYDKYDLSPEATSTLQSIGSFMKEHGNLHILIEGNADERGSAEYNIGLGDNRARAAKNYLVNYGIDANRIETTSYGKERPAFPNCGADDKCHAKNRRDEWKKVSN
jgi:peptidoglycan-associated lipoprotein